MKEGVNGGDGWRDSRPGPAGWRPDPVAPHRAAETNKSKLAAPDSSAPTREPEMPERKHARGPRLFWRDRSRWRSEERRVGEEGRARGWGEGDRRGERGRTMERLAGPIRGK